METSFIGKLKKFVIGKAKNPHDPQLFHKLSLIAFFAWVGLGADGLSSSCYGPEEAFLALKGHMFLGIFVAIASVITIFVISSSYNQVVELFPEGGGGYLVASKLLNPTLGMISGSALIIDYVLTITISIASGADALYSFLPYSWMPTKIYFAVFGVIILTVLNMRGVKESVVPLVLPFMIFIVTHVFAILYTFAIKIFEFDDVAIATMNDLRSTQLELGTFGMLILIMRAYSMGAGTYTGIEAVSNGVGMLREPKVKTAKLTMRYMSTSLSFMVMGLMLGYLLYRVQHVPGRTLNAAFLENVIQGWNPQIGYIFLLVTLLSETVILFVAAQTGFLGGPRVVANMALDRWWPSHFAMLSERFVIQNGVLIMGLSSVILMAISRGSVKFLVVLYSINVFITFFLAQLGILKYWWTTKIEKRKWVKKIVVTSIGLLLTGFILVSVTTIKFFEGGWITIFITGSLAVTAYFIKRHYTVTHALIKKLDTLINLDDLRTKSKPFAQGLSPLKPDMDAKTAVILVTGYNALGLHTLFNVIRQFGDTFKNYLFVEIGVLNVGNFKAQEEITKLNTRVQADLNKYVEFMKAQGFYSEGFFAIGIDVIEELNMLCAKIYEKYPRSMFFGGQVVFPKDTLVTRLLYNQTTFVIQRKLYQQGIPFLIMPIRVS